MEHRSTEHISLAVQTGRLLGAVRRLGRRRASVPPATPSLGLALGGGFARGIAHVGVLRVFEQYQIPIGYIAGVSAGSIVAAAYASGASLDEIARMAAAMRFTDVARWCLSRMGLAASERMEPFLRRLLKVSRFEEMRIPLGVVATDLATGAPTFFHGSGDVMLPVRASCSYPGLFLPVRHEGKLLVDGGMSMEVPAALLRHMGTKRVISVHLPMAQTIARDPRNMFQVISRCFQIMQSRTDREWKEHSDFVIAPEVSGVDWDAFGSADKLIQAGEIAALEAVPAIKAWLSSPINAPGPRPPRYRLAN